MTASVKYDDAMTIKMPTGTTALMREAAAFEGIKPADLYRRAIQKELRPILEAMELAGKSSARRTA